MTEVVAGQLDRGDRRGAARTPHRTPARRIAAPIPLSTYTRAGGPEPERRRTPPSSRTPIVSSPPSTAPSAGLVRVFDSVAVEVHDGLDLRYCWRSRDPVADLRERSPTSRDRDPAALRGELGDRPRQPLPHPQPQIGLQHRPGGGRGHRVQIGQRRSGPPPVRQLGAQLALVRWD